MIKRFSKILLTLLIIFSLIFSYSFATDVHEHDHSEEDNHVHTVSEETLTSSSTEETENSEATENSEENQIIEDNLYLCGTNIVMDKLVDGNVYIFGKDVTISGQVKGNLFVFALGTIRFEGCYIIYDIYACAPSIYYNGTCNNLYVSTLNLETTYDSCVYRDLFALSSNTIFKAAVGRNATINSKNIDFGSDEDIPIVYGNLNYKSISNQELSKAIVPSGTINYTSYIDYISIIVIAFMCIITSIVVYLLIKFFLPKFEENLNNEKLSVLRILIYLGIGISLTIAILVASMLLYLSKVGIILAAILIKLFELLSLVCIPVFIILVAKKIRTLINFKNKYIIYGLIALISILTNVICYIPCYVGIILFTIFFFISLGNVTNVLFIHLKNPTEEEKQKRLEEKKMKKEELLKQKNEKKKNIL